jgi:tRNA threonylcarbamoyl adenosine modification protein YeaZ
MNLLALEFSSSRRSAAILEYDDLDRFRVRASVSENQSRGVSGLVLVDQAIKTASLTPSEISRIGIGLGPGSYTGIRSAIAIAQGWQLAHKTGLLGISTIEVLAADAKKHGFKGELNLVIDAQRNELYSARYNLNDCPPAPLEKLHLVPFAAIPSIVPIAGPDVQKLISQCIPLFPSAETLAELALRAASSIPGEKLEPLYLRETSFVKAAPPRTIG